MPGPRINFDHLGNGPVLPEVLEAMLPFLSLDHGNPSALHREGLKARDAIHKAREQVTDLLHADSEDSVLFTSSGTEALNLAVKGVALRNREYGDHVITTNAEHPAIAGSMEWLESMGFRVTRVAVGPNGRVEPGAIEEVVTDHTILTATHLANFDVGTLQPVRDIARGLAGRGIPFLVDATFAAGWTPIDVREYGLALVALAPHRFYGPKGVGVLFKHPKVHLSPLIHGGDQEFELRAGTENVSGIVGAGKAAALAACRLEDRMRHVETLQALLWKGLGERIEGLELNGPPPGPLRIGHQLNVSPKGTEGEGLMLMCDVQGAAIGAGTACMRHTDKASPVLTALGADRDRIKAATLLSFGEENTQEEVDRFVALFARMVERLREMN